MNKAIPKKQYLYNIFLGIQPCELYKSAPVGLALGSMMPKSANKIMHAQTAIGLIPNATLKE